MKLFVSGAGGFIGSSLVSFLSGQGHSVSFHVRSKDGDLCLEKVPPDTQVVINAAGRLGGKGVDRDSMMESNARLPVVLADFCAENGAHLIHLSTPGVTGLAPGATEEDEYSPWGDYERSKTMAEESLLGHASLPAERLTVLRPDFVYGPGDLHKLPLFKKVASGFMPVVGRCGARLRPTYCLDVCRAVEASLPGGVLGAGLYNIAGPATVTVRELSRMIAVKLDRKVRIVPLPRMLFKMALLLGPLCPGALSESRLRLFGDDHFVSIDKASRAGFSPQWTLEDGISETVSWYLSEGLIS